MFCFWCGDELVDVRGELTCIAGEMGLSQKLEAMLEVGEANLRGGLGNVFGISPPIDPSGDGPVIHVRKSSFFRT